MSDNSAFLNAIRQAAMSKLPQARPDTKKQVSVTPPAVKPNPAAIVPHGSNGNPIVSNVRQGWPEANIEFNLSGNTLTIEFNDRLTTAESSMIQAYGYVYSDKYNRWLNDYSDKAVQFLNDKLGENLDFPSKVRASQQTAPIAPAVIPDETFPDDSEGEAFKKYKKQVDALLVKLNMHPADLMLAAIDCMYKMEFPQ